MALTAFRYNVLYTTPVDGRAIQTRKLNIARSLAYINSNIFGEAKVYRLSDGELLETWVKGEKQ